MQYYVHCRQADGTYLINVNKTFQKIQLAARIIAAVADPSKIPIIAGRPEAQRAAMKFSRFIGSKSYAGRYLAGTFTNRMAPKYFEPELVIVADPAVDH